MENQETNTPETPSKEDVIKWMNDQIEFKKVQLELRTIDASIAEQNLRYAEALYRLSQYTTPESGDEEMHTISKEDLENNPELKDNFKEGDVVRIPKEENKKRSLKK